MKFAFIAAHRSIWPVAWLCSALEVSRSGFHAWLTRPRSQRAQTDEAIAPQVRASFLASERTYGARDRERGVPSTVAWLAEEMGELAQAVRKGDQAQREHEFADVLAWVASLANQVGVDLTHAVERYAAGCPTCGLVPCTCP